MFTSLGGALRLANDLTPAIHHVLATSDNLGQDHPQLAVELPTTAKGTWVVRADGPMQTTYRIRPNVTWHDGTPLTAKDFVFAWAVHNDPDVPMSDRLVANQIARIDTPDDHTLVIEWRQTYPFAHAIVQPDVGPLPVHILEPIYRADKERFNSAAYWTREFVGTGAYRIDDWELGTHLVLKAYEGFYGSRPKIDTITVRFYPNAPTAVSGLLAGALDGVMPATIDFSQSIFVKEEWERAGKKPTFVIQTTQWRFLAPQFRDPNPRDLRDVRVRRALLHAIDRQAMVDTLLGGQAPVSDTFIPPDDRRWDWVKDVIVRYPYDTRRSEQLLAEAGWRKGSDGVYANPAGERVSLPFWTTAGEQSEQEVAIVSDYWKTIGIGTEPLIIPRPLQQDNRYRAQYPGIETGAAPLWFENTLLRFYGPNCPVEERRWVGSNKGCYQNPNLDRVADALKVAIDPDQQRRLYGELLRIETEELPALPTYFDVRITLVREGVLNVKGKALPVGGAMWNVEHWDLPSS